MIFLNEKVLMLEYVAMAIAFGGVVLVGIGGTKDAVATVVDSVIDTTVNSGYDSRFIMGLALAFFTAWGFAGINVGNRRLHDVHFSVILLLNSILGFLFCLSWVGIEGLIYGFHFHTFTQYCYLVVMAVIDYGALTCAFIAYQADSPSFISLLSNMTVFYSFIVDYLVFNAIVSGPQLIGALCILMAALGTAYVKMKSAD
jgi:drug/metabolite transporter (DMT)-like permease